MAKVSHALNHSAMEPNLDGGLKILLANDTASVNKVMVNAAHTDGKVLCGVTVAVGMVATLLHYNTIIIHLYYKFIQARTSERESSNF